MIKVKSTSLDFGKMDREPIDLLIANACEFESVQVDANSDEQGIARDIIAVLKGQSPKFPANKEWLVPNR